ncbi:hypothetical protein [Chondrinema litorale]|uniref:hypothetical protein n=1 Tax=Chondrinema litorale TaxID=2994555 RepID=UPI002543FB54|nr:hypothetical protein [Chondrinema litorale]UZR93671.1 hypothetical protein OQ292_17630 [Chondrinema litorale]
MDPLFKKLNFKDQDEVVVLHAPKSFLPNLENMQGLTKVFESAEELKSIGFLLVFVTEKEVMENIVRTNAEKFEGDTLVWIAYPKKSSKKYTCNFNRDTGWEVFGEHDMEPVRQVAIDEDWSALRFRKIDYIKKMTRRESFALSEKAKSRLPKK